MVRTLYFVTSYRNPEQVLRLTATIRRESPDAEILVHHDRFRTRLDALELSNAAPGTHLVTSPAPLSWGDFSVVDMHWRCFAWALERMSFDWLIFMSEQDYPVRPLAETEQRLASSGADAFMDAYTVDATTPWPRKLGYYRYFYSYSAIPGTALANRVPAPWTPAYRRWRQRVVDRTNHHPRLLVRAEPYPDGIPTRIGVRRRSTPFSDSFACWVAGAWFALSRRAVEEVVRFIRAHPSYRRYYRWTIVPEESATASIVLNSPDLRIVPRNLHFERWSKPDSGHPDVLRSEDIQEIMSSGMPFARKFDLRDDLAVLDALDAQRQQSHPADGALAQPIPVEMQSRSDPGS